jgi:hypothetical protein
MYGFQIGADVELINFDSRFHIDGVFTAGILANDAEQRTSAPVIAQIPGTSSVISASDDHTAFVGEIGLRGVYDLTPGLSVFGGYHAIWLDGIALAPDQIPVTDLFAPSATLDTGGTLLLHGASVGVEVSF